jgi:hypothetical protein
MEWVDKGERSGVKNKGKRMDVKILELSGGSIELSG